MAKEPKTGKMTSFIPKMNGGVHESFTNSHNQVNYKFEVKFDNLDVGLANSTKTTPSWVLGHSYSYDKEVGQYDTKFTGLKDLDKDSAPTRTGNSSGAGGNYTSYYDKPEVQKAINLQFCLDTSVQYSMTMMAINKAKKEHGTDEEKAKEYPTITETLQEQFRKAMFEWMYAQELSTAEFVNMRSAINTVLKAMSFYNINSGKELLNKAKEIYVRLKEERNAIAAEATPPPPAPEPKPQDDSDDLPF